MLKVPDWLHKQLLTKRGKWLLDHKHAVAYSWDTAARANERLSEARSSSPFNSTLMNEHWWYTVDERLARGVRTDGEPCTLQPIIVRERDKHALERSEGLEVTDVSKSRST